MTRIVVPGAIVALRVALVVALVRRFTLQAALANFEVGVADGVGVGLASTVGPPAVNRHA